MLVDAANAPIRPDTAGKEQIMQTRRQVVDRALHWILASLPYFNPLDPANRIDEPKLKAFNELLLLGKLMLRHGWDRQEPKLAALIAFAESILEHPAFEDGIRRSETQETYHRLRAYIDRETWRGPDPQKRQEIQRVIDAGLLERRESQPFQLLELRDWLDPGGFRHSLPDRATIYRQTVAHRLPSPLNLPQYDTYVITHVILYLTDWGFHDPAEFLGDQLAATVEFVRLRLGMALRDRDWDLAAELLMCFTCLRRDPGPLNGWAWRALAEAQSSAGNVPNPKKFDPDSPILLDPHTGPQYIFDTTYHATLVTIMAGILDAAATAGLEASCTR